MHLERTLAQQIGSANDSQKVESSSCSK